MSNKIRTPLAPLSLVIFSLMFAVCAVLTRAQEAPQHKHSRPQRATPKTGKYACSMHPEVVSKSPGRCRKCGMDLKAVGDRQSRRADAAATMDKTHAADANKSETTANVKSEAMVEVALPKATASQPTTGEQNLQKTSSATPSSTTSPTATAQEEADDVASRQKKLAAVASKYFPNLVLVDQDNKSVHFYDDLLKGKTVLINFMLTHCTGACSPMTANLLKVQKYLGAVVGKDVLMISISVDPEHDTPAALKKYADDFKIQPGWHFLTGTKANVDGVLSKLGGYTDDPQKHSTVLLIGDEATGQWMKVPALSKPSEIADAVARMLSAKKGAESAAPTER